MTLPTGNGFVFDVQEHRHLMRSNMFLYACENSSLAVAFASSSLLSSYIADCADHKVSAARSKPVLMLYDSCGIRRNEPEQASVPSVALPAGGFRTAAQLLQHAHGGGSGWS